MTLRLPRRVRVHGTLRLAGAPATDEHGVWWTIKTGGRGEWTQCGKDGTYEMFLSPGAYVVWATDAEGNWSLTEVTVPDTDELRLDIER